MRRPETVYTDAEKRRELDRRAAVRRALLSDLPPPDAAWAGAPTAFRPDRWPPRPDHPGDLHPPRDRWGRVNPAGTWDADKLVALVGTFAAARGPDFSKEEFLRWALIGCGTVNRYCGSWRAARVAAGLPPRAARRDRALDSLHRLLRVLHLNRGRRVPLTGPQLAAAAKLGSGPVERFGGVRHLRDLYRLWVGMHRPDAGGAGTGAESEGKTGAKSAGGEE